VDAFTCTNEVVYPMESAKIEKANVIGADMKELFDPQNIRTNYPGDFIQRAERLIEKYKDK
jgi:hypothetical protein